MSWLAPGPFCKEYLDQANRSAASDRLGGPAVAGYGVRERVLTR